MSIENLKEGIEKLAKEENITFIEACRAMQGAAVGMEAAGIITADMADETIKEIHALKMAAFEALP